MVLKRFLHSAKKALSGGGADEDWLDGELRGSKGLASVGKEDSFSSFKKRKPGKLGAGENPDAEIDDIDDLM